MPIAYGSFHAMGSLPVNITKYTIYNLMLLASGFRSMASTYLKCSRANIVRNGDPTILYFPKPTGHIDQIMDAPAF